MIKTITILNIFVQFLFVFEYKFQNKTKQKIVKINLKIAMNTFAMITFFLLLSSFVLIVNNFAHLWLKVFNKKPSLNFIFSFSFLQSQLVLIVLTIMTATFQVLSIISFTCFHIFYKIYYRYSIFRRFNRNNIYKCFCTDTNEFYAKKTKIFSVLTVFQVLPTLFTVISLMIMLTTGQQAMDELESKYFSVKVMGSFSVNKTSVDFTNKTNTIFGDYHQNDKMKMATASLQLIQSTLDCCGLVDSSDYHVVNEHHLVDDLGRAWVPASCCAKSSENEPKVDWFESLDRSTSICLLSMVQHTQSEVKTGCFQKLVKVFFSPLVWYLSGTFILQLLTLVCTLFFFSIFYN